MGVSKLWNILVEAKEEVDIRNLRGKTFAVDFATWVYQAKKAKAGAGENAYIRILFQRIRYFIKMGINLVFVLDGEASPLKFDAIARRAKEKDGSNWRPSSGSRRGLDESFEELCELLDALGLRWIRAEGEGEALCAELDKRGLVDGVITEDGDVFLYGARNVYRNSRQNTKDKFFTNIEHYNCRTIENKLHMNQNYFMALGLLLGCELYEKGVKGVGEKKAMKLLNSWAERDVDPLQIFQQWKSGSSSGASKEQLQKTKEMKIQAEAVKDPNFASEEVIDEFKRKQGYIHPETEEVEDLPSDLNDSFAWRLSSIEDICKVLNKKLGWKPSTCVKQVIGIATSYLLRCEGSIAEVEIHSVLKAVTRKGVPSYQVRWNLKGYAKKLGNSSETDESQDCIRAAFPTQVSEYEKRKEKAEAEKKQRQKKARRPSTKAKRSMPDHFKASKIRKMSE